jgi:hypothetical protein
VLGGQRLPESVRQRASGPRLVLLDFRRLLRLFGADLPRSVRRRGRRRGRKRWGWRIGRSVQRYADLRERHALLPQSHRWEWRRVPELVRRRHRGVPEKLRLFRRGHLPHRGLFRGRRRPATLGCRGPRLRGRAARIRCGTERRGALPHRDSVAQRGRRVGQPRPRIQLREQRHARADRLRIVGFARPSQRVERFEQGIFRARGDG